LTRNPVVSEAPLADFGPQTREMKLLMRRSRPGRLISTVGSSAIDAVDGSSTGARVCDRYEALIASRLLFRGVTMQAITTIGLDIAKSVFQVHCVDAEGKAVLRRQLKRRYVLAFFQKLPSCLVGIETCASSHYWSREL
jgi:hypothetical protein